MRRSLLALTCLLALAAAGCQKQDLAQKERKTEARICSQLAAVGQGHLPGVHVINDVGVGEHQTLGGIDHHSGSLAPLPHLPEGSPNKSRSRGSSRAG